MDKLERNGAYFYNALPLSNLRARRKGSRERGEERRIGKFPLFPLLHGELVFGRFYIVQFPFSCLSLSYINNITLDP